MRENIPGCRLYLWTHRAGISCGCPFNYSKLGAFMMKVSLVALVAGCAIASSAFGLFDNPPMTPPHLALLEASPMTPPHLALLDNPPMTPPHLALLDNPPMTPPHLALLDNPPM